MPPLRNDLLERSLDDANSLLRVLLGERGSQHKADARPGLDNLLTAQALCLADHDTLRERVLDGYPLLGIERLHGDEVNDPVL